jgi:hypothetical protein
MVKSRQNKVRNLITDQVKKRQLYLPSKTPKEPLDKANKRYSTTSPAVLPVRIYKQSHPRRPSVIGSSFQHTYRKVQPGMQNIQS